MKCSRTMNVVITSFTMMALFVLLCILCRTAHHNDNGITLDMKNGNIIHAEEKDANTETYTTETSTSTSTVVTEKLTDLNIRDEDVEPQYPVFCDVGESSGDYGTLLERGYETDDEDIPDFHRMCSVLDAYSKNQGSSNFRGLLETYASVFSKDAARKGKLRKTMLKHNIPEKCKQFIMSLAEAFNYADLLARFEDF